jgi:hypothetical protein
LNSNQALLPFPTQPIIIRAPEDADFSPEDLKADFEATDDDLPECFFPEEEAS